MKIQAELKQFLFDKGISDVGFAKIEDSDIEGCQYALSVVIRLSNAIVDEISESGPTLTYFNHYRTINAFIDKTLLEAGLFLQHAGYSYVPVAASQSVNTAGWSYSGRYSHKKVACLAGLGTIGKNSLFIHNSFGSRVRLGTLFTNCEFETENKIPVSPCKKCTKCVHACPSGAISGKEWEPGIKREELFDAEKCSEHMKKEYQHIGRGAVCGICMMVCPMCSNKRENKKMKGV